ncbi:MAG: TRAP transporter substrate-binding protein [Gammaproteobacteria bacterium]|jgi:TRAP-type C4-dicarboxylate transport system substrate-binding protein|nr:TRAP transporter substrate-binding protein [Gammaproteobacteria bacterium]NCW73532.1 TRAP transporter substrate-binding protein [Gammaproteobacteria bacterium]
MTDNNEIKSLERRNFLKLSGSAGFTAAVVAGAGGALLSTPAMAVTAKEEKEREKAAKYTMTIATAYKLGASREYPIMQLDMKENIQNATNGAVYVKLAPNKQLGAGGALVQKVQNGTIQCAQHSLSNFAPFASAVDLINMPYFCGANQRFVNLVQSDAWKKYVHPKVEQNGFKPLMYVVIDPRVVAVRKGGDKVITPDDLKGVKFRVPGSKMLQQYYRMVGANPTPIAWGETPSAIKQGVADALDPSVGALLTFGFKDILSHVTFTQAVPDAQVYSCNMEWFSSLPAKVQDGVMFGSEISTQQNLAKVPGARNYAMAELTKAGVEFHSLTDAQLDQWKQAGGYQKSEWDSFKVELAGSMDIFNELENAANTRGRYYVHDA